MDRQVREFTDEEFDVYTKKHDPCMQCYSGNVVDCVNCNRYDKYHRDNNKGYEWFYEDDNDE